tara:strand:+ start:311 stop:526 length:216 start_codon:yes stop_codon:yes gene_type:complete
METNKRTTVKIIIWQCVALSVTIIILLIAMGDISKAITYGLIDHSICMTLHFFYDKIWQKINWGIKDSQNN